MYHWVATPVPGSMDFVRVTGTIRDACGLTTDRRTFCWETNSRSPTPTLVAGEIDWAGS